MTTPRYYVGRRWISHCQDMALVGLVGHWADETCLICLNAEATKSEGYYTVTKVEPEAPGGARITLESP